MRLYALSDLHVGHLQNRRALESIPRHPDDWLILAGDLGETLEHLDFVLDTMGARFAKLVWVPGNHELWAVPEKNGSGERLRGEAKYLACVERCRARGVLTPEDPFVRWEGEGGPHLICPLFVLYDYSFRPDSVAREDVLAWAREGGIECVDEHLLHPDPFPSREAWCEARVLASEAKLEAAVAEHRLPTVLINHYPLRRELAVLPAVPRFTPWCGTRRTEEWHRRYGANVVVFGHLHIRQSRRIDGVRFEEVSLGYPRQWHDARGPVAYLRTILPA